MKVELTLHVVPIFMKHLIKAVLIERGVDQMKTFLLKFSVILNIKRTYLLFLASNHMWFHAQFTW